jgi:hypothetical protein
LEDFFNSLLEALCARGSFLPSALFGQTFLTPERDTSRNSACYDIAHFPGGSDQQAKLAENQMSFFEVGLSLCFGHEDFCLLWDVAAQR